MEFAFPALLGKTAAPAELKSAAAAAKAIVIGPGLGQSPAAHERLDWLVGRYVSR